MWFTPVLACCQVKALHIFDQLVANTLNVYAP